MMAIRRAKLLSCQLLLTFNIISTVLADVHHQLHQQINQQLNRPHPKIPEVKMPYIEDIPTSSIVLEQSSSKRTDLNFIHLIDPATIYVPNQILHVEYSCQDGDIMGVEVLANDFKLFYVDWVCMEGVGSIQTMYVKVTLPDRLSYQPDYINRQPPLMITNMKYRLWIIPDSWSHLKKTNAYELSLANSEYTVMAPLPYDRPMKDYDSVVCLPWNVQILLRFRTEEVLRCDFETDVVQLIKYPVAMSGGLSGITREIPEFNSKYLNAQKQKHITNPRFTVSTLIYIVDYCKQHLCSIFHRKTHYTNKYVTPLIFLNPKGEIHIQVVLSNGQASSMLSNYKLPKHQWIRVIFSQQGKKWKLYMSHGKGFGTTITATADFGRQVKFNDTDGLIHLGGSQSVASFRGYLAETKIWRNRVLNQHQISFPSLTEDMYVVGIEESYRKCNMFINKMEQIYNVYRAQRDWIVSQKSCPNTLKTIVGLEPTYFPAKPFCRLWGRHPPRSQQLLWNALKRDAFAGRVYNQSFIALGNMLYDLATSKLVEGMTVVPKIIPILKQASCYDSNQASYMLSSIYSGGVGITPNRYKGIMYQMKAAEGDYQPALCAMGDKHQYGQEGLPQDYDYAFNYLKNVADRTVKDKEKHDADGVFTEMVRLTDTDALQHQTGEKGDYFLWMKYQAKKGLAEAQINLARMLFWGQHGVTRDIALAIEYFNEYLANNPADPLANYDMAVILLRSTVARLTFWGQGGVKRDVKKAVKYYAKVVREAPRNPIGLYDYGIVLLRGQGIDKNVTKALEHLNKSAELGHAPAYTALGWYALNHEKNITKAIKYFEKADKMGHRDAAHNLGYLYRAGKYPNHSIDEVMAFKYYYKAATAGHVDSGVMVAEMHNQGNPEMPRNSAHAVLWARFIAEQNSEMGRILRKGLDAYLQGSWAESLIYYMMAAEAGVEVAQFNLAYLCEEDHENIAASYVHTDCIWKYYNKSSNANQPPVLAQLKMGDYHWYGYQGANDTQKAVDFYGKAAAQKDPQAIFNLGYIVEQGVDVRPSLLKSLGIRQSVNKSMDRRTIAMELYRKCRDHSNKDAYVPCGLAVMRMQWQELWIKHTLFMKVTSAILFGLASSLTFATCLTHIRGYESSVENV